MKKRSIRLYNVIFPVWLLWLFPISWLVVLPGNFLIDLLVVVLTLKHLQVPDVKKTAKATMFRVWLCGFLADFLGTAVMFLGVGLNVETTTAFGRWWSDHIAAALSLNPFENIFSFLYVAICVVISGICIYYFNYKISLKRTELEDGAKRKLSLSLAVFTAPYLFFLPTIWFYR